MDNKSAVDNGAATVAAAATTTAAPLAAKEEAMGNAAVLLEFGAEGVDNSIRPADSERALPERFKRTLEARGEAVVEGAAEVVALIEWSVDTTAAPMEPKTAPGLKRRSLALRVKRRIVGTDGSSPLSGTVIVCICETVLRCGDDRDGDEVAVEVPVEVTCAIIIDAGRLGERSNGRVNIDEPATALV